MDISPAELKFSQILGNSPVKEMIENLAFPLGLSVFLISEQGNFIFNNGVSPVLCSHIRKSGSQEKYTSCKNSIIRIARESIHSDMEILSRCHCGLIFLSSPLKLGTYGSFALVAGGVLFRKYSIEESTEILTRIWNGTPPPSDIVHKFTQINVIDSGNVSRIRNSLSQIGSNIQSIMNNYLYPLGITSNNTTEEIITSETGFLKNSQIIDLRRQLNPHFLFNTLNAINQLALLEGALETQELTLQFSEYLRYVMRKQDQSELVSLEFELDGITRLLEIYRIRYRNQWKYEIFCPSNTKKVRIPFMILQPIVENSIFHGIEPSLSNGYLKINSRLVESFLIIEVADNGVGYDPSSSSEGLGLKIVKQRLALHYGDMGHCHIISAPGKGTQVTLSIPSQGDFAS